jgi:hypothetical protein
MKKLASFFAVGLGAAMSFGASDRSLASNAASRDGGPDFGGNVLHFEGFVTSNSDTLFVVSLKRSEGSLSARAWVKLGQTFAGHVLSHFDSQNQILSVTSTADRVYHLHLAESKVTGSKGKDRSEAFSRAMGFVEEARKGIRKQWDVPIELRFDLDGSTMPDVVRARFLAQQEEEEAKGGYLVGILVDGSWVFSPYRGQASKLIPSTLSDSDRREVEAAWALLHAEGMARGTAYEKRKKGGPLKR